MNHELSQDILIDRLGKHIDDAGVIRLILAYLTAGIMDGGVVVDRHLGTPQGGPLSPLLTNELLDGGLRHRLRAIQRWQWKRPNTIYRELKVLGASQDGANQVAGNCHPWWRSSDGAIKRVLTIAYFDQLGVPRLS